MPITPSSRDITHAEIEHYLRGLHTSMPGEVVKVYDGGQFVDVLPSLQVRAFDEDGAEIDEKLPVIPKVPLAALRLGPFVLSMPVAVGNIVTLQFAERSLDQWIQQAKRGSGKQILPGDIGMHPLDGAIALPFEPAHAHEPLSVHATNLVVGVHGGGQIHITPDGAVLIGSAGAAQKLVLGTTHIAQLKTLMQALGVLVTALVDTTGVPSGAKTTFGTALTAFITHLDTTALSSKHKVDAG